MVLALAWHVAVDTVAHQDIRQLAIDAHAYWAVDTRSLYHGAVIGDLDAFLYTPAAGQLLDPVGAVPWPLFYSIWLAGLLIVLVLLLGPVAAALTIFLPPVWADLTTGNVHILIALSIVLGMKWSAAWAMPLLTKVTPGIGLLWFAVRREWRPLFIAVGVTGGLAAVSYISAPSLWAAWLQVLGSNANEPARVLGWPLAMRLPLAAGLVIVGAWRGWKWMIPVASMLALPVLWENSVTVLFAIPSLIGWGPLGRLGNPPERAEIRSGQVGPEYR
ncbi:MAG TPA: glycosyltransferase family 87 protein [Candidatus Limnocylindria bacterium]